MPENQLLDLSAVDITESWGGSDALTGDDESPEAALACLEPCTACADCGCGGSCGC
ncbi:hypothetical protein ACFV23_32410 [Streptomyces sp. NPDC059627]